jgi:polar amino acid transport system permease protein
VATSDSVASGDAEGPGSAGRDEVAPIKAIPVRHRGRWVAAAIILVLAAQFVHWLFTEPEFDWSTVRHYLFAPSILTGVVHTIELTVIAMIMGIVLGVVLAVMRLAANPIVSGAAWIYIWFFRGTPVLVQLIFWFALPSVVHSISVGVPFGPGWLVTNDVQSLVTKFIAVCLGLGLNEAAYMAEIARAGILSVDEGQVEAASALGMTRIQSMRRIVLPQAMRVIIPPTGNETISMLKTSSLALVIGYAELLESAQIIYDRTYQTIPLLIVASLWYLFMTSILTVGQYYIERRYARGALRELPPTPLQKLRMLSIRPGRLAT